MAVGDSPFSQIVGRHFQSDAVTRQNAYAVSAELSRQMCENGTILVKLNTEQSAREFLDNGACHFNTIFFTHPPPEIDVRIRTARKTGIRYRKVYRALMHIVENFGRLFYP